ncbi:MULTISPECIES: hypothetical protein [unclassified Methylophaga]|jgi:hypothetical protein|uniref:hypothetical protein n=2 Tax=unclassified Methylophaga TaxID=2629249 RepID=UPI00259D1E0B|nr:MULTISPECIES: hypothetical protein [unclassified Methylophaga]|tara:strand:+ start:39543 stop:39794 length:252 start_codon:yes stop_codon:yes gene_type:complete
MMSDVICPYCGTEQEIIHDDGQGYEENIDHEQQCDCGKTFKFQTSISFNYEVFCNEGDHEMEAAGDKWPGLYSCNKCDFFEKR